MKVWLCGRLAASFAVIALAGVPMAAQETAGRGFLFGAPNGSFSFRVGYAGANAGSDVFAFVTDELTLKRGDFGAVGFGVDVAASVSRRFDIVLSFDGGGMSKQSEFREWEDTEGRPIEQVTRFARQTYGVSGRYYLAPNGRTLGRLAWVPARYVPWVSAGVGRTMYSLEQEGDFIDFQDGNRVFSDRFKSSQWTTTGQVAAGVDWNLTQRFALTSQARYLWGKADLEYDFSGFDPIDISGFGLTAGLSIRY